MAAVVEVAFLVLAKAVVVLVVGRVKAGAHLEVRRVRRARIEAVVCGGGVHLRKDVRVAVFVIRHRHRPVLEIQQCLAVRTGDGEGNPWRRAQEILARIAGVFRVLRIVMRNGHLHRHAIRAVNVNVAAALIFPARLRWLRGDAVAGGRERGLFFEAHRDA